MKEGGGRGGEEQEDGEERGEAGKRVKREEEGEKGRGRGEEGKRRRGEREDINIHNLLNGIVLGHTTHLCYFNLHPGSAW